MTRWSEWKPWAGGECPVPPRTEVDALLRIDEPRKPGSERMVCIAEDLRWTHTLSETRSGLGDVVFYAVREP